MRETLLLHQLLSVSKPQIFSRDVCEPWMGNRKSIFWGGLYFFPLTHFDAINYHVHNDKASATKTTVSQPLVIGKNKPTKGTFNFRLASTRSSRIFFQLPTDPSNGPFNFIKLDSDPVCFGTTDSQFGSFKALTGGKLMKIKLVHLYGYISCAGVAISLLEVPWTGLPSP